MTEAGSGETPDTDTYALRSEKAERIPAPELDYRPPVPSNYRPAIGLVGAGGIAAAHLDAYRAAGFDVRTICSRTLQNAQSRRDEFYPKAQATEDFESLLQDESIEVLDITPHPEDRVELIERALMAGKHVLSQKPFVIDLSTGERLVALAKESGVKLAVNQNGRWSPHMAYMRKAVQQGFVGTLTSCHTSVHWDHQWIGGTPFEAIDDLILYDFAIHWFDFLTSLAPGRIKSVYAMKSKAAGQTVKPQLLAQALVRLDDGQASLIFDGATSFGPRDRTFIGGSQGSIESSGPDLGSQELRLAIEKGLAVPQLEGTWFNDGFRGAMGELLCAIEEGREPENGASANLDSLALTFAAIASAHLGREVELGEARAVSSFQT